MAAHSFLLRKLLSGAGQHQGEIGFHIIEVSSHSLVHDVADVEILLFFSIVASLARGLSERSRIVYRPWKYKLITPPIILYM